MDKSFLYEQDFYGWTQQQAKALEQRLVLELDWQHLQEEIQAYDFHPNDDILEKLLNLNLELAEKEKQGIQIIGPWSPN